MIRILYLAHDLSDAGIWRRVEMLIAGGAEVAVAGFRRVDSEVPVECTVVELGRTENARLGKRALSVARARLSLGRTLSGLSAPDLVIARNLEMLALAAPALRVLGAPAAPIVYECLDIHRMMLRSDALGTALRGLERRLAQRVSLLLTSSPAFLRNYFDRYETVPAPVEIVENRFLELAPAPEAPVAGACPGPIRIGWFGILRCARSLDFLDRLTRAADGRIEVILRGKPARDALPTLDGVLAANPQLRLEGPYRYPDDLAAIYGAVDFAWLIDWYDAGENSEWLLPNRLYEGCRFGAVPIARKGTEIARVLEQLGIGVVTEGRSPEYLAQELTGLSLEDVARLKAAVARTGKARWSVDRDACRALVGRLSALRVPGGEVMVSERVGS